MNDGLPEAESALRARILAIHQEDKQKWALCALHRVVRPYGSHPG